MAGVVKQDIPEISDFMSDFWKFMKSTWITEDNDDYWQDVIDRCHDLCEKYKNHAFVVSQLSEYVHYLDKKHRGKVQL